MAIIYQIYPLSFLDTNNDGIGDINGITKKISYLKELGVEYLWITPIFYRQWKIMVMMLVIIIRLIRSLEQSMI